ncbi:DUF4367 domain-containing protein [Fusicatenibacter sp.]
MKKIEKEEQLKKKLEQTAGERIAADSKTVKGESAVGNSKEEKNAAEQEPELTLSEEELNAMYERFQKRLQQEGLADAEGNPTEKTLQIRRQMVEKRAEREKQAKRQKQAEKKAKTAKTGKPWVRVAKAAGVVLIVGACVFGASMTSQANRIRLGNSVHGLWNGGDATVTNNGEVRKYSAGSLDDAQKEIREVLHAAVPEFYYIPEEMKYKGFCVIQEVQTAVIKYRYKKHFVYFQVSANEKDLSQGNWKDKEKVQIETLDNTVEVEMGTLSENEEENYYAIWKYRDFYYELSGQIEKEELLKILNEMQYNL